MKREDKIVPNTQQTDKPAEDKTADVAQGKTENGMTLGDTPGQGSATGENGAQDKAVADAAEIVQGHVIPQDVLDAIEAKVVAFRGASTPEYDSPEHLREYLIAQYIVAQYPSAPTATPQDADFDRLVATAEGEAVGRYIVAHSAVGPYKQGEEFAVPHSVDVQRLLDLGAITPA